MLDKAKAIFTNYGVRAWKWSLQKYYNFDKWHIVSLRQRKYARDIIDFCNRRTIRNSFLEIGCGLGDIVRNVKYKDKYGYDIDDRVLKAAAFMNKINLGSKIIFSVFRFPGSPLPYKYDVIVMVNWIHHIEPELLKSKIEEYFNNSLNQQGVIIIDAVQHPDYKFNHDINYLVQNLKSDTVKLGDYERQREIWLIKK